MFTGVRAVSAASRTAGRRAFSAASAPAASTGISFRLTDEQIALQVRKYIGLEPHCIVGGLALQRKTRQLSDVR